MITIFLYATEKFIEFINYLIHLCCIYVCLYLCIFISIMYFSFFNLSSIYLPIYHLFSYHLSVVKVNLLKVNIYVEEKSSLFSCLSYQNMSQTLELYNLYQI